MELEKRLCSERVELVLPEQQLWRHPSRREENLLALVPFRELEQQRLRWDWP